METQEKAEIIESQNTDGKEIVRGISNKKFFELIDDSLKDRHEYEIRLANHNLQRYGRNRPKVNNKPWPGASNYFRKKVDEVIEQKKAFFSQIIHASQFIASFRAMVPQNNQYASLAEAYFDFIIKEQTMFEREIIYSLDSGLEAGFSFMKVLWSEDEQRVEFKWVDNLFLITPSKSLELEDLPWVAHVIQMSRDDAIDKYGHLKGFNELAKRVTASDRAEKNDSGGLDEDRYERKGINLSDTDRFIVWEIHYKDPNGTGRKRMRTLCPDDPKFDFEDDREYLYPIEGKQEYMFKQFRREFTTPDLYSSRGIAEIIQEEQLMLTHLARLKHNYMSFVVNPAFTAPNGLTTTNTNNIHFGPGYVMPGDLQPIQFPPPPVNMDQETSNIESIIDRRMNSSSAAPTAPNTIYTGGEGNKTAREISYRASLQTLAVNYETLTWKKFIRETLRYAWMLIVENKPETLQAFIQNTVQDIPPEAINKDYNLVLSWSADNINKEFNIQQAAGLWQQSINNPFANALESWKNLTDQLAPGQGQRFVSETAELQQEMQKKQLLQQYAAMEAQKQAQNQANIIAMQNQMQGMQAQGMSAMAPAAPPQGGETLESLRNQIAGAEAQKQAATIQ